MSELIRTFTITVGKVYNGSFECRHPKVDLVDSTATVSCIDRKKGIYRVQLGPNDSTSALAFEVKCDDADCDVCETQTIVKIFCDSSSDCGENEFCDGQGFCSSLIGIQFGEDGEVLSTGVECDPQTPCPGNKICQNGRCACPVGTFEDGDYCSDCRTAADCELCQTCEDNGQYRECKTKDCNCNTEGDCVECTNSGHCGQNEVCNERNECECVPGSIRIGGICTEIECTGDDNCEDCEICNGIVCTPIQCPPGKAIEIVNNVCSCVEICEDCDPEVVCSGSCETGLDCGEGCGCEDNKCVKCSDIGCGACSAVLGCVCTDNDCEPDTCNNVTCVTPKDCTFGCTCESGLCESCGNYSVEDCTKPGCTPVGGVCVGKPEGPTDPDSPPDCEDRITITKNDDCTITGEIVKTSCCSCSPLTIDGFISKVGTTGSNKKVDFTVELRKGVFATVDPFANPLLNAVHPEIAENEEPLSGTISISASTQYAVTINGRLIGLTTEVTETGILPIGGKTSVTFTNVPIYSVGFSITNGTEIKTVVKTTVDITHSGAFVCENLCVYDSGTKIGTFVFKDNSEFTVKQPAVGTTVYSGICRKPFVKWTKSEDSTFNEQPFRKIYPDEVGGVYTDIVNPADGAESCFNYQLESDCNCGDPATEYIVFCNPSTFPKPELSNCNKTAEIQIDAACLANRDKIYDLYLNNARVDSFTLNEPYENTITSVEAITSITLKLRCDSGSLCDITHEYEAEEREADPTIACNSDGTYSAEWNDVNITKVQWGDTSLLETEEIADSGVVTLSNLESGKTYYYKIFFGNCTITGTFSKVCPASIIPLVDCNSDGTYTISNLKEDGVYTITDYDSPEAQTLGAITPAFGQYILSAEDSLTAKVLNYEVSGFSGQIIISAYNNSSCCNVVFSHWTEGLELHVIIHEAEFPVVVTVSDVPPQTAAAADVELIFVLPQAGNYTITPICDGFPDCFTELPITVEECELTVDLMASSIGCDYIATASEANCACDNGYVTIDNIVVTNHPGGVVDPEDPYHSDYVELTYRLLVSVPNVDAGSNGISELTISIPGEIDGGHDEVTQVGEYFSGYSNFDGFQCYNGEYPCDNCAYGNLTINLRLEDGCEYTGSFILYLCRGGERIYSPDFSTSFNLVPSGSKYPQFDWSVNGNLVKTEHENGISPTSTLSVEEGDIDAGDSIGISLSCGGCTATASTNECLSTEITNIELSELNSHVYFELDTCYLNSIVSVSLYDCGNNLIDIVTTSGSNLNDGYTFELGSSLCMGTSKLTYAFYGSGCVGEVEFDVPELSSESSSISSSVSSSISSSISSSQSSSISSSVSPSSSVSSSVSPSSSVSSSTSPSQSVSSSISPSASISSSPSTSLSPSFSISSSPSLGSSPSSSISSSVSPSSSISSSLSPSSSISSSVSSSVSSSPSSSLSPSSSTSSSPSSSISSSISSSESSSISPSSSISSSISSSPSSSYSPSESISSSPSSGTSASSSISSSVSPSSSRSSSVSSSRSSSRSSSVSPSSSRSSSVSSSPSSSRSSSISPSTSISNSPSSSRSSSRSSSISSSPSVPPDLCDCYTGTITLASVSCHLGNCWFFGSTTFTRLNSACPSLLSYTESDFIMTGSFYGTAADSISGTADEIGVEFSMNLSGEAGSCGDQTMGLYGIDVVGDDACLFDTQFVPMSSCIGSCTPPCLP